MSEPTPEQLFIEATRLIYEKSYYKFFIDFWDKVETHKLVEAPYMEYLCNEVQQIFEWVADMDNQPEDAYDLLVNIAPGSSKSSVISNFSVPYLWILNKDISVIAASYSGEAVKGFTSKMKKVFRSDAFLRYFPDITLEEDNVGIQRNQGKGLRIATSIGGTITGKHADILLCIPKGTTLRTEKGLIDIADIIERDINAKVWTYNHETSVGELSRITKKHKPHETNELVEITTSNGSLRCTPEHPVYVKNKGYVEAQLVCEGDVVVLYSNG